MTKLVSRSVLKDMADRTVSTFLQTFAALELSSLANITDLQATKAALLAALLATVKSSAQSALKARREAKAA